MLTIAFAVVEVEVKEIWQWFVDKLIKDIQPISKHNWGFISDEQKVHYVYERSQI